MTSMSTYRAAALERSAVSASGRNCDVARDAVNTHDVETWLSYAQSSLGTAASVPSTHVVNALSSIVWNSSCFEVIEPLTGVARHPLSSPWPCNLQKQLRRAGAKYPVKFRNGAAANKYDIGYLVLNNWCTPSVGQGRCRPTSSISQRPRVLYYDLGCSKFGRMRTPSYNESWVLPVGVGPSIPLFHALYARNCMVFDEMWAWESHRIPKWWQSVPPKMSKKLHFFNEPVNTTDTSALGVLKATALPSDFVVLKLDIDSPELEKAIIERIINTPSLYSRIDELFFEYHFWVDDQRKKPQGVSNDTVTEAIDIMQRLRRLGIRSHFWV